MKVRRTLIAVLALGTLALMHDEAPAQTKFVNIGTASIAGAYYPAGGQICNLVNRGREKYGYTFRCSVESTGGSTANARAMKAGDLEIALLQSDTAFKAWNGTEEFKDIGPNKDLRFLFSLHPDLFHIVTRAGKPVKTITDLKGQAVNTGSPGTGSESALYSALPVYGMTPQSLFGRDVKLTPREQGSALCDGKIDAFIYETGIGSASIIEPTTVCKATVSGWWDDTIAKMVAQTPFLIAATIPKGSYEGQTEDLKTWGNVTVVAVSSRLPDDVAYFITKAVFDNFDQLREQHVSFRAMTPANSAKSGQVIPYHPGSLKFFREAKLVSP